MKKTEVKIYTDFVDHISRVTKNFFEVSTDFNQLHEIGELDLHMSHLADSVLPLPKPRALTPHQSYLLSLAHITEPILQLDFSFRRINIAKPKLRELNASRMLVNPVREAAHEAYHFQERLNIYAEMSTALIPEKKSADSFYTTIRSIRRGFEKTNSRILRHRHFLVHRPKGSMDEFEYLNGLALNSFILHSDLWFEFQNEFYQYRDEWRGIVNNLRIDMLKCLTLVRSKNEHAIEQRIFDFTQTPTQS